MTAEVRRGTLRAFDGGTYRATVQLDGSLAVWIESVPVARNLPSAELVAGRSVAVLFWDASNPGDAVVVAVWA